MAIGTKTEYALRALLEIPAKSSVSANQICERQQLPKKYVEHLLSALKKAGLIASSSGSRGGYTLARPAGQINLYNIMEAVNDHNLELDCGMGKQFCLGDDCPLRPLFVDLAARQRELLQKYSLARIAKLFTQEKK